MCYIGEVRYGQRPNEMPAHAALAFELALETLGIKHPVVQAWFNYQDFAFPEEAHVVHHDTKKLATGIFVFSAPKNRQGLVGPMVNIEECTPQNAVERLVEIVHDKYILPKLNTFLTFLVHQRDGQVRGVYMLPLRNYWMLRDLDGQSIIIQGISVPKVRDFVCAALGIQGEGR